MRKQFLLILCSAFAVQGFFSSQFVFAQQEMQPRAPATRATQNWNGLLAERLAQFRLAEHNGAPLVRVRRHVRGRPVLEMKSSSQPTLNTYAQSFLSDTVEVMFKPDASQYGHILVRAGDYIYDLGNVRFARARPFMQTMSSEWGEVYGFLFKSNPQDIATVKQILADKVAQVQRGEIQFTVSGTGATENCAEFVSSVLETEMPYLGIPRSYGAIGMCRTLLTRNENIEAVNVYSRSDWSGFLKKLQ